MPSQLINRAAYGAVCNNNPQSVAIIQSMHLMGVERAGRLNDMGLDVIPIFPDISDPSFGLGPRDTQLPGINYGEGTIYQQYPESGLNFYCPVTINTFAWTWRAGSGYSTIMPFKNYPFLAGALQQYPLKQSYIWDDGNGPYYVPWLDDYQTTVQQIKNDAANSAAGKPLIPLKTLDGIVPYVGSRFRAYQLGMDWRALAQQEKAATDLLLETQTPAVAAAISSQSITNPLGTALLNRIVTGIAVQQTPGAQINQAPSGPSTLAPSPINSLLNGIGVDPNSIALPTLQARADVSLPTGISTGNKLTQQQTAAQEFNLALGATSQESYSSSAQEAVNALAAQADNLAYWKSNYPNVQILPEQNPQIDRKWLYETWPDSMGPSPLVNVQITPRQKPLPTKGFLASNSWLSAIVSVVPVVGVVLSVAVAEASAAQMKSYQNAFQAESDNYKPQYYPKPFNIILPLNDAKLIQNQPWYAENVATNFVNSINMAQLNQMTDTYNSFARSTQQQAPQDQTPATIPLITGSGNPRFSLADYNTPTSQDAVATNKLRLALGVLALLAG